jgi:hypothetical protein
MLIPATRVARDDAVELPKVYRASTPLASTVLICVNIGAVVAKTQRRGAGVCCDHTTTGATRIAADPRYRVSGSQTGLANLGGRLARPL